MYCCVSEDGWGRNGRTGEGAGFLRKHVQGRLIYCGIRAVHSKNILIDSEGWKGFV